MIHTALTPYTSRHNRGRSSLAIGLLAVLPLLWASASTAQGTLPPHGSISTLPPPGSISAQPPLPNLIRARPPHKAKTPSHHKKAARPHKVHVIIVHPTHIKVIAPGRIRLPHTHPAARPRVVHHDSVLIHNAPVQPKPGPVAIATAVASPSGLLLPGLVARWPADDNSNDVVGDSNGTFHEGRPSVSVPDMSLRYATGKIGSAFNFSGTEPTFRAPNVAGLAPGNTPHSVALWLKAASFPTAGHVWLLLLGNVGSKSLSHHWLLHPGGRLQVGAWGGKGISGYVKADAWTHVATTFDGTTLTLYIDGAPAATEHAKFDLQGIPLAMGQRQNTGSHSFTGLVDDIGIYNRALSAAEVASLYQAGNTPPATP